MKVLLKIWSVISTVLVVAAALLAVLAAGISLSGIQAVTVPDGTLLLVKEAEMAGLQAGEEIVFLRSADMTDVGRIASPERDETDPGLLHFQMEDGTLVYSKNVLGREVATLSGLGHGVDFIRTPAGLFALVLLGLALLLLVFLPELLSPRKEKRRRKKGGKYLK